MLSALEKKVFVYVLGHTQHTLFVCFLHTGHICLYVSRPAENVVYATGPTEHALCYGNLRLQNN